MPMFSSQGVGASVENAEITNGAVSLQKLDAFLKALILGGA